MFNKFSGQVRAFNITYMTLNRTAKTSKTLLAFQKRRSLLQQRETVLSLISAHPTLAASQNTTQSTRDAACALLALLMAVAVVSDAGAAAFGEVSASIERL